MSLWYARKGITNMLIRMDTRPVNAFKLSIWSKERLLFEDVIFSKPEVNIDLQEFSGGTLEFKWSFYFTEEEQQIIKKRDDFPKEGFFSYYIENDVDNASDNMLYGSFMPSAEGMYYTIVENISASCNAIKMAFVETDVGDGLLLLNLSSSGDKKFGRAYFRKQENAENIMKDSKRIFKQKIKKLRNFTAILNVFFLGWVIFWFKIMEDYSFSSWVLTIIIAGFVVFNFVNYLLQTKSYKELEKAYLELDAFRLNHGKIERLDKKV